MFINSGLLSNPNKNLHEEKIHFSPSITVLFGYVEIKNKKKKASTSVYSDTAPLAIYDKMKVKTIKRLSRIRPRLKAFARYESTALNSN